MDVWPHRSFNAAAILVLTGNYLLSFDDYEAQARLAHQQGPLQGVQIVLEIWVQAWRDLHHEQDLSTLWCLKAALSIWSHSVSLRLIMWLLLHSQERLLLI